MSQYNQKPRQELVDELRKRDTVDTVLVITDKKYAIKLIEKIVFTLVALILTAFIAGLIRLVFVQDQGTHTEKIQTAQKP